MNPKILVTGAFGFVGGSFVRQIQKEFDVFVIDRQLPPGISLDNFFKIDLTELEAEIKLSDCLKKHHFETAIHFAAATPHTGITNQTDYLAVNTIGTFHLLQAIREKVNKFAFISTVDIYGIVQNSIIDEVSPPNPTNIYGISKFAAEMETQIWNKETLIPSAIFRLGQIYGPGDPSKKAIPNFCRAVVNNKPITIQGEGNDIRQPIYLQDVISAIETWVKNKPSEGISHYLIVGSEQISIQSLAEIISQLDPHKKVEIIKQPAKKPEIQQVFNNNRTRQMLNWKPVIPLTEGLKNTLMSMQN